MSSSNTPEAGGIEMNLGRRAGKAPERSNFAHTCNLLSQFFKERGALAMAAGKQLELEATTSKGKSEVFRSPAVTTMSLLPNIEKSTEMPDLNIVLPNIKKSTETPPDLNAGPSSSSDVKSMDLDLFRKLAGPSTTSMEDTTTVSKADFRKPETTDSATSQMTIFYAGKILVYNDFPADKAKEIMALAERTKQVSCSGTPGTNKINSSYAVVTESNIVSTPGIIECAQRPPQANGSDLPIATRASLHRFFSKRKDRAATKAPYQVNGRPRPAVDFPPPPKPVESDNPLPDMMELEGQSSKRHLDLNL